LKPLRAELFSQGIQSGNWGIKSRLLAEKLACLQFVDDTTLLATSREESEELTTKYAQFCAKFRLNLNIKKCSVTHMRSVRKNHPRFKRRDEIESAFGHWKNITKEESKKRTESNKKRTRKLVRSASQQETESRQKRAHKEPVFMTIHGQPVPETQVVRILGPEFSWCLKTQNIEETTKKRTIKQLTQVPWIRTNMGRDHAAHWAESTAAPRILFGAGIAKLPENVARKLSNQMQKAVMGWGPREGQYQPPAICLREQAPNAPWDQRILRDNTTVLAIDHRI
jgi:hypothetical protein